MGLEGGLRIQFSFASGKNMTPFLCINNLCLNIVQLKLGISVDIHFICDCFTRISHYANNKKSASPPRIPLVAGSEHGSAIINVLNLFLDAYITTLDYRL